MTIGYGAAIVGKLTAWHAVSMPRSRLVSVAMVTMVTIGLIPIARGTSALAPKPAGFTTFRVLSDALSDADWGPALISHRGSTPGKGFQPSDPRSSNAFFVLLDPLQPAPGNGDESAWLYHAWEIRQEWDPVVVVAEVRELRTLAEPARLASMQEMDTEEIALALAEEPDSEVQAEPTPAPETVRATRFVPQAVVVLTLLVGLLGLVFAKPGQLPGHRQ